MQWLYEDGQKTSSQVNNPNCSYQINKLDMNGLDENEHHNGSGLGGIDSPR